MKNSRTSVTIALRCYGENTIACFVKRTITTDAACTLDNKVII